MFTENLFPSCPNFKVCQETSPESSEGPIPSSPARMSPLLSNPDDPPDLDLGSQPPVIHDIVTSSPSDNEHLGATPFVTNIDLGAPLDIPASELLPAEPEKSRSASPPTEAPVTTEQVLDTPANIGSMSAGPAGEIPVFTAESEVNVPTETRAATFPPSHVETDISFAPEGTEPPSQYQESLVTETLIDDRPAPETVGSVDAEEETAVEEEMEQSEAAIQDERAGEEEEDDEGMGSTYRMFCENACMLYQMLELKWRVFWRRKFEVFGQNSLVIVISDIFSLLICTLDGWFQRFRSVA